MKKLITAVAGVALAVGLTARTASAGSRTAAFLLDTRADMLAEVLPASCTYSLGEDEVLTVKFAADASNVQYVLPDGLGPLAFDLNGKTLVGKAGTAGSVSAAGGNGAGVFKVGSSTTITVLDSTGSSGRIIGGQGGDGNPEGKGAFAFVDVSGAEFAVTDAKGLIQKGADGVSLKTQAELEKVFDTAHTATTVKPMYDASGALVGHKVTLGQGYGPLTLANDFGAVTIDLNGWTIKGTDGASAAATAGGNGRAAITVDGTSGAAAGVTTITVRDDSCVQLWKGGPYFAVRNIGATKPEECGYYFWWGDTVGYVRNSSNNGWDAVDGSKKDFSFIAANCQTYNKTIAQLYNNGNGYIDANSTDGKLKPEYDAATVHWGAPWRMPTKAELDNLKSNCTMTWTSNWDGTGMAGFVVKGKATGYTDKSIFLPAAGGISGSSSANPGPTGNYWSSMPNLSSAAWLLYFDQTGTDAYSFGDRVLGFSVRAVRGSEEARPTSGSAAVLIGGNGGDGTTAGKGSPAVAYADGTAVTVNDPDGLIQNGTDGLELEPSTLSLGEFDIVTRTFAGAEGGGVANYDTLTIYLGQEKTANDSVTLPMVSGYTRDSEKSTDYTVVVNVSPAKTAGEIAGEYLSKVQFSFANAQTVNATLSNGARQQGIFYFAGNGHYYQYVKFSDTVLSWDEAYEAARKTYYGERQGYLATITSKEEDMYVYSASQGSVGWLGGTVLKPGSKNGQYYDSFTLTTSKGTTYYNSYWYWACGPECGEEFFDTFSMSCPYSYDRDSKEAREIYERNVNKGYYFNWNNDSEKASEYWEPNTDNESCLTTLPMQRGCSTGDTISEYTWNNIVYNRKTASKWTPQGYLIEFGDQKIGDSHGDVQEDRISAVGTVMKLSSQITLDAQDGEGGTASVTATYGSAMPEATMPTKTGYTFLGYFDAVAGGVKYYNADGTSAKAWDKTEETTLYARWQIKSYTATLDLAGGEGAKSTSVTYGQIPAKIAVPTKSGAKFLGFFTEADGKGTRVFDEYGIASEKWMTDADATLHAYWANVLWTSGTVPAAVDLREVRPATVFKPETLASSPKGWEADAETAAIFDAIGGGKPVTVVDSVTANATVWTPQSVGLHTLTHSIGEAAETAKFLVEGFTYTVAFDANGGTGDAMETQTLAYGAEGTAPSCTYTRADYEFDGWNTRKDGTGDAIAVGGAFSNLVTSPDETGTLYAMWKVVSTVAYEVEVTEGGTPRSEPIQVPTAWITENLPGADPEKPAEVKKELEKTDPDTGLKTWQEYVLDVKPGDKNAKIWIDSPQQKEKDKIKVKMREFSPTKGTGFTVKYRLDTELKGKEKAKGDLANSPDFDIDVSKGDPTGLYTINVVFVPEGKESSDEVVESVNTMGILKVPSPKALEIVAVPWNRLAPDENQAVLVADLVKTATLTPGDKLHVYDRAKKTYKSWSYDVSQGWVALGTFKVTAAGLEQTLAPDQTEQIVARGSAVWLERQDVSKPFYLYGQYSKDEVATKVEKNQHNLVASPKMEPFDLNGGGIAGAVNANDQIIVPNDGGVPKVYSCRNGKWGYSKITEVNGIPRSQFVTDDAVVPVGTGFWYVSKGGNPTIRW